MHRLSAGRFTLGVGRGIAAIYSAFGIPPVTTAQMAERDRLVTSWCLHRRLPVAVLYGGGYHREPGMTARLHANTIQLVAEHYASTRGRDERPARPHESPRTREPRVPVSKQEA